MEFPMLTRKQKKFSIVNIFLGGKSEFAFPKIVQRIVQRIGKRGGGGGGGGGG
jgi:hypothetical protein